MAVKCYGMKEDRNRSNGENRRVLTERKKDAIDNMYRISSIIGIGHK